MRRRTVAALGTLVAAVVAIGVIVATSASGSSGGTKAPAAAPGSATVQRRDLVETDTESGTLSYASSQTVFNRLSGTITSLPSIGQVIQSGQTLYDVDSQPVVLLGGSTPAFRDLSPSDSAGPDILELNRDLVSLGFDASDPITVNDTWQDATTSAVERWQGSLGQSETGTISLGQVVFLPGPQRVTAIDTVLGSTGGSGSGGGAGAGAAGSGSSTGASVAVIPRPQFVSLTKTTTTVTTPRTTTTKRRTTATKPRRPRHSTGAAGGSSSSGSATLAELKALEALLRAETAELRAAKSGSGASGRSSGAARSSASARTSDGSSSSRSGGGGGSAGSAGGSGGGGGAASAGAGANAQPILQTSSTQMVVTVDLDASKQSEAVVGAPVTVELPDGSTVDGKITGVSPVAESSSGSSSSGGSSGSGGGSSSAGGSGSSGATVPVTVSLPAHLSTTGLDQAAVSVNFEQQSAHNVLSVPVTALLATQGGGYAVQEAVAPHQLLPVTVGLFAAGYVQISGGDIYPGLQVTDSQG